MSVADRLEEIEGRAGSQVLIKILSAPDGVTISDADYARRTDDTFALVAALRAGLAVHADHVAPLVRTGRDESQCLCTACDMARAISAALDGAL